MCKNDSRWIFILNKDNFFFTNRALGSQFRSFWLLQRGASGWLSMTGYTLEKWHRQPSSSTWKYFTNSAFISPIPLYNFYYLDLWYIRRVCFTLVHRSCGQIFCADCSENVVALPCEQLYEPVRVCTKCYQINPEAQKSASNGHGGSGVPCGSPNSISSSLSSNGTLSNSVVSLNTTSNTLYATNGLKSSTSPATIVSNACLKSMASCKQAAAGEEHTQSSILSHLPPTSTS